MNQEAGIQQIGDLLMKYRAARALMTAAELGIFDTLAEAPRSAEDVAVEVHADPRRTEILLDALVAAGLLRKESARYANTPTGQQHLLTNSRDSLISNLRYQEKLAPAWADLPQIVRTGRPHSGLGDLLAADPDFAEHYIRGMSEISRHPARELVSQLDLSRARRALDVGGGPGAYALALAEAAPELQVDLLDLAPTLKVARDWLAQAPAADRITLREGDYLRTDNYGEGYDLVLLSHVTHDEGERENQQMFQHAHAALQPGGVLVVHDFMVDTDRVAPTFGALFSLHLCTYTAKGRTYSADEYRSWMQAAGFQRTREVAVCADRPNATNALIGTRP